MAVTLFYFLKSGRYKKDTQGFGEGYRKIILRTYTRNFQGLLCKIKP